MTSQGIEATTFWLRRRLTQSTILKLVPPEDGHKTETCNGYWINIQTSVALDGNPEPDQSTMLPCAPRTKSLTYSYWAILAHSVGAPTLEWIHLNVFAKSSKVVLMQLDLFWFKELWRSTNTLGPQQHDVPYGILWISEDVFTGL
jgi:hypothetical protein